MTRQEEACYLARLDLEHTCHCGRGEPSLLGDRPSGWHPLAQANEAFGDYNPDSRQARQRHYVTNKALPAPPSTASERMKAVRAGLRWSDSPEAVRSRQTRARRKLKEQGRAK